MIYTVIWLPSADEQLADLWKEAPDRDEVNRAVDWITSQLRSDPDTKAYQEGDAWFFSSGPLGVWFQMVEEDRKVEIGGVVPMNP